jgi:hypothetical protein
MKDDKKAHSSESDRQKRVRASLARARETLARMDKKYGKPNPLSEDELEARWRHLMQSGKFIDEN